MNYDRYNPALSLRENAEVLGCSLSALKKHLRKNAIDVQYDAAYMRWRAINDYRKAHPGLSLQQKSEALGFSVNTIRKYEAMSEETLDLLKRNTKKVSHFDIKNINAIKTVSSSQTEILRWIMHLYNNDQPFDCDLTASVLIFYKHIPTPNHIFDKYPQLPQVRPLVEADGLPDGCFQSIVYDLPFIISSGAMSMMKERFSHFESVQELYQANDEMLERAYRLLQPGGLLVIKTMDVNHGGTQYWVSDYVLRNAQEMGLKLLEKFILVSTWRLFSKTRTQHQARKYHSYFFVFKK